MNANISKAEQRLVDKLKKHIPTLGQQLRINNYLYDIHHEGRIIEFNGDYWHANPELYLFEDYVGNILDNRPTRAYEIWAKDEKKRQTAEENGYEVLVVWESEFSVAPNSTVERCLSFLLKR